MMPSTFLAGIRVRSPEVGTNFRTGWLPSGGRPRGTPRRGRRMRFSSPVREDVAARNNPTLSRRHAE